MNGRNVAVPGYADAQDNASAVPGAPGDEFLLPAVFNPHRAAGLAGQQSGQDGQPRLVLVAIPAAQVGADYADLPGVPSQRLGQGVPVGVNAAGGFPHREVVAVPGG